MTGALVGVDLGKSGCRVEVQTAAGRRTGAGAGAPGLAEPGGAAAALAAVTRVLDPLLDGWAVDALAVGAAGAGAASRAARDLGGALAGRYPGADVVVTGDALTAHAGALAGAPGVVLAAGTGAIACGVDDAGRVRRVDGWGQWLGDDGGGAWIGREALRAVLRARDGRGPATGLTAAAEQRYGDLAGLPAVLPLQPATAGRTAAFVPDVVACARADDAVAGRLLGEAARLLAETTAAVLPAQQTPVAMVGGLAAVPELVDGWRARLPRTARVVAAAGDGVAGALLLAGRRDLPHESAVWRTDQVEVA